MASLHRLERLPVEILDPPEALARAAARRIADLIRSRAAQGQGTVLGLATGSTPVGVYAELVRLHKEEGLSFKTVETFNLDEYWPMAPESLHSYHRFMREHLFDLVDLDPTKCHVPPGSVDREQVDAVCAAYEQQIRDAGGIDLQLLGIGKTGHIGFNEPGSGADSRTRLVTLDAVTRRDAAADFFGERNVPRQAITMGVATILEAREILLLATGEHKAGILRRAIEGEIDHHVAATFLQQHPNTVVYCDGAASADLTRIATPWLLDEIEWTPDLELRAVAWLSQTAGKAILKLTEADYAEHHLSPLVARHGEAGAVNGEAFNALGAKIRGRSKLPKGKTIICFSPHPDDDVISAGGILRKLILNENKILVAYMTSGNIAVFDHDALRYVEVIERLASDAHLGRRAVDSLAERVRASLDAKAPGDIDSAEVQDLKRVIREGEAVSGIETLGLSRHNARFLNLPFYQTGKVKKDPIGPRDVAIIRALLEEINPDLVLVAGDLSDPHGTHRLCKDAIELALHEVKPLGITPEVWLYRGAWQEWPVTEATWLVPLAQEELKLKIQAIFKHQSQKDSAPFPGQDDREFWQRVEARNKGTAELLNQLGLAEYFAMEAYVVG
ncbi:MAG: glucosamine-6-phosphate deaminase [Gemmatimonadales bacterium]|nr:glucosamine-6-phosphate deaminase [Gemmatimonadales bacterium]MBP9898725.1 glucosamine-6-phosphate deaminase [Gemmatimonadales bacterium]